MNEQKPAPAESSARGKVLMVIAAIVVAGLGYLAWSAQRPRGSVIVARGPEPAASQPASAPASRPARGARPRPPRAFSRAPVVAPASAPDGGLLRSSLTRVHIREAQARLHHAADPCVEDALKKNPNLGLRMAIRYTLYVQGGEARAINPKITKNFVNDPDVERCIIDKITHTRWPVQASDGVLPVAESFNFKHLTRTHIGD